MTLELVFLGMSGIGLVLGALALMTGARDGRRVRVVAGRPDFLSGAAFIVAFGAVGFLVARLQNGNAVLSVPTALAAGLGGAWLTTLLPTSVDDGAETAGPRPEVVGTVGTLSLPIREGACGELAYSDGGSTRTCIARSQNGCAIEKGTEVLVTGYENGTAIVRRIEDVLPGVRQAVRRIEAASAEQVTRRMRGNC